MALGFVYKFLSGAILTSFVVYPALEDPKSFLEGVTSWIGKVTPFVTDVIGGVI